MGCPQFCWKWRGLTAFSGVASQSYQRRGFQWVDAKVKMEVDSSSGVFPMMRPLAPRAAPFQPPRRPGRKLTHVLASAHFVRGASGISKVHRKAIRFYCSCGSHHFPKQKGRFQVKPRSRDATNSSTTHMSWCADSFNSKGLK